MIRAIILSASVLAGCDTMGEIRRSVEDGVPVVEHIDTNDQPDDCPRAHNTGCFQLVTLNGIVVEKRIWKSSVAPSHVARHEAAHKGDGRSPGMQHTEWQRHPLYGVAMTDYQRSQPRNAVLCATITVGYAGYPLGHLLCNDGRSEWTIAP